MDRQRMKGGLKKATGTVKEKIGRAMGDRRLEAEGKAERAEGRVLSAFGKARDSARSFFKR
jgi:uncharacterized protein YjbJ (UPF0337 family)